MSTAVCTQNSARSQMAEGFLRHLAGDRLEVYSAGIDPTDEVHPCTVEAMSEVGIDIADQYPKGLRTYLGKEFFNYLIIVCARASDPEHPVSVLVEPQRGENVGGVAVDHALDHRAVRTVRDAQAVRSFLELNGFAHDLAPVRDLDGRVDTDPPIMCRVLFLVQTTAPFLQLGYHYGSTKVVVSHTYISKSPPRLPSPDGRLIPNSSR
jgi:protein-tyrosine-phosphatase